MSDSQRAFFSITSRHIFLYTWVHSYLFHVSVLGGLVAGGQQTLEPLSELTKHHVIRKTCRRPMKGQLHKTFQFLSFAFIICLNVDQFSRIYWKKECNLSKTNHEYKENSFFCSSLIITLKIQQDFLFLHFASIKSFPPAAYLAGKCGLPPEVLPP